MVQFFYDMVVRAKRNKRSYWPWLYKVNKVLLNMLYPMTQRWNHRPGTDEKGKVIVSLTTYPGRIHQVWKTLATLLNQTMPPRKVILWLGEEQFPDRALPANLVRMTGRGLEIRYCTDLKSHKKYFEAFSRFPDEVVVTADDDILYPENHLEKLWQAYEENPNTVICHWSHRIEMDGEETFVPYNQWEDNGKEEPSYATLAVGCNGILYPPARQFDKASDLLNPRKIQELALRADDLWLKCMEILCGIKTVNCNDTILIYYNVLSTRKSGLWVTNTGHEKNNDGVWTKLMEQYPEVRDRLKAEMR